MLYALSFLYVGELYSQTAIRISFQDSIPNPVDTTLWIHRLAASNYEPLLFFSNPSYSEDSLIKESIENKTFVFVDMDQDNILGIRPLPEENRDSIMAATLLPYGWNRSYQDSIFAMRLIDFNKKYGKNLNRIRKYAKREYKTVKRNLTDVITESQLDSLMKDILAQSCQEGCIPENCIPFDFRYKGCTQRLRRMLKIAWEHKISCCPISAHGTLVTPNSKKCPASYARRQCVGWGSHHALVFDVETENGIDKRVIDPSLSISPIDTATWRSLMTEECVSTNFFKEPKFDYMDIGPPYLFLNMSTTLWTISSVTAPLKYNCCRCWREKCEEDY